MDISSNDPCYLVRGANAEEKRIWSQTPGAGLFNPNKKRFEIEKLNYWRADLVLENLDIV